MQKGFFSPISTNLSTIVLFKQQFYRKAMTTAGYINQPDIMQKGLFSPISTILSTIVLFNQQFNRSNVYCMVLWINMILWKKVKHQPVFLYQYTCRFHQPTILPKSNDNGRLYKSTWYNSNRFIQPDINKPVNYRAHQPTILPKQWLLQVV